MERKTLKIHEPASSTFERFKQPEETQTEAMRRLLDRADVSEVLICSNCGSEIFGMHVRTESGEPTCAGCAGIEHTEAEQLLDGIEARETRETSETSD